MQKKLPQVPIFLDTFPPITNEDVTQNSPSGQTDLPRRLSNRWNRINWARVDRFHDLQHSHPGACHHKTTAFRAKRFDHVRAIEARGVVKNRFVGRRAVEGHTWSNRERDCYFELHSDGGINARENLP